MGLIFRNIINDEGNKIMEYERFSNFSKKPFDRVKHFKRDEFYAYDDELRIYLGEDNYPDYLKY